MATDYRLARKPVTWGSLAYVPQDPNRGNAQSGGGASHMWDEPDAYGVIKQDDPLYESVIRGLVNQRYGGGLNSMVQMGGRPGDIGAVNTATMNAIAQMQNPAQFVMNQRAGVNNASGMAEGMMVGAKPAKRVAEGLGAVGDIAEAGLDAWAAYQDEKDMNAAANEQIRQAEHQARQQTRESGGLIDDTRRNFAMGSPGAAARRAMRGSQLGRGRVYWDGGL